MSHSKTCLFLAVALLSVAFLTGCIHMRTTESDAATSTPALAATTGHPPSPTRPAEAPTEIQGLELVSYLGATQAQAISVQGSYAYVGIGAELAVVDVSDLGCAGRVGYVLLPNRVFGVAAAGSYAYVATGRDGLHIVDISDPTQPIVLDTYYASSHVSSVAVSGLHAFVSAGGALHILDLSDSAAPVKVGIFYVPMNVVSEVVAVVDDTVYAIYHGGSSKSGGLHIVNISDPAAPVEVGTFVAGSLVRDAAESGDHAYLLVGQGIPRLVVVDISDPTQPTEVSLDRVAPWLGQSLTAVGRYVYLAYPDSPDSTAHLKVLDVADPAHPAQLGRYEDITPPSADIVLQGERAYIATGDGLHVVNVVDPTAPVGAGHYCPDAMTRTGRDVTLAGHYAYVAAGGDGLQVVDVSDPVNPKVVSHHDTAGHAWDVALASDYAYLADEYNGLRVIDVASPFNPVEVGFYDIPGLYEFFHGVAVAGSYAYIADGGLLNTGLRVVDISDPAHPTEVSFLPIKIQTADDSLPARAEGVAVANGYVYLAAGTAGLRVVEVSDPAAPTEIGFYDTPGRADNLAVVGHHIYLADGDLRIVDVSNPTAPALVGFFDIPGMPSTPHVAVQGRYAYVTGNGTQILDVSDLDRPVKVAAHPIASGNVAVSGGEVYVVGNGLFILRSLGPADVKPQMPPPSAQNDECGTHTAAMTLSAMTTALNVGEAFTVTVTLSNQGCGSLGMPQYRLYVESDQQFPLSSRSFYLDLA